MKKTRCSSDCGRFGKNSFAWVIFLLFVSLAFARVATAQDLPGSDAGDMPKQEALGTPIAQIVNALESGGLVTPKKDAEDAIKAPADAEASAETPATVPEQTQNGKVAGAFDSNLLENLATKGGLVTGAQAAASSDDQTMFKLAARFLARVVFKNEAEFSQTPKFDDGFDVSGIPTFDQDTAGFAIIKKGNQSVQIDFDEEYEYPPIVTATISLQQYKDKDVQAAAADLLLISDVGYIISDVTSRGFEIVMDRNADSDIPFSWHALAVRKPKTSKKAGDSFQSDAPANDFSGTTTNMQGPGNQRTTDLVPPLPQAVGQSTDAADNMANGGANSPAQGNSSGGGNQSAPRQNISNQ